MPRLARTRHSIHHGRLPSLTYLELSTAMFTLFSQAPVKPTPIQSQQASHESNPPLNDEAGYEQRPNPASTDAPGEPRFRYIGIAGGFVFTAFILGYLAPQLQIRSLRKQIQKLKEVQSRMAPQEALQSIKKGYEGRLGDLLKEMAKNKEQTSKLRDEIAGLREGLRRQADKLGSHQEEVDQKAAELEKRQRYALDKDLGHLPISAI